MRFLLILGLAVILSVCLSGPTSAFKPRPVNIVNANDEIRTKILPHLEKGNLVMSTISLASVLGMLLAGAKKNTKSQLLNTFGMSKETIVASAFQLSLKAIKDFENNPNVTLRSANRIYVDNGGKLLPEYMSHLKSFYSAEPKNIDFKADLKKASTEINKWVEQQTNDKIKDLLEPEDLQNAKLVLVNAIYFKGDWESAFMKNKTKEMDFATSKDETRRVKMMFQKDYFGMIENNKELRQASVLCLPYKGRSVEMLIILPNLGTTLDTVEKNIGQFLRNLKKTKESNGDDGFTYGEVNVYIPKFKLESKLDLVEPMQKVGVTDMFSNKADFSGMISKANIHVSVIKQKAFIEVNEEGTEAAAATGLGLGAVSMPPEPKTFKADRPFFFLIRESATGMVLFSGRVVDPSKE